MSGSESPTKTRTLRKAPSLVLNAPTTASATPLNAQLKYTPRKPGKLRWTSSTNIVPDSEEENSYTPGESVDRKDRKDVIVISSDEEDANEPVKYNPTTGDDLSSSPKKPKRVVRRIVQSSDESEGDSRPATKSEVIEISDNSSDEEEALPRIPQPTSRSNSRIPQVAISADGSVMTWDAPVSPRKPLRVPANENTTAGSSTRLNKELPNSVLKPSAPTTASPAPKTPRSRPNTKKAQAEAELKRLAEFTQILFNDLNRDVFNSGLPADIELCWSKRLNTTAGRATYARKDGIISGKIELATKILDSEERVMKTLSHEMCHLACWIINKKLNEHHGPLFKAWAARVTAKRPDIEVSTTHDYEISYKFEWRCEICDLVYGRHSKSIKPDDVCGRCHEGKLIPLFTQRQRKAPQTPKVSRMAASKPRNSPLRISPRLSDALKDDTIDLTICSVDSDEEVAHAAAESDSEVEVLAALLGSTTIAGTSS
ncbi:SprT-like family-domain-containing protein [Desarmillaria tabescens]|uniref:SprT-like family-domain-containing protein n=1 Tax=Armillaria tabescens TaxID=1929756 RepID=A0AA39MTV7_ARMTA|nr:SprT-like family-domain-containing protein [Desarmillaria tabescens]KAK0446432.1 SprT-like family-domain-containing protein [Desarmillaria tabescens]